MNANHLKFYLTNYFVARLLTKKRKAHQDLFPMLHHEESQEKR